MSGVQPKAVEDNEAIEWRTARTLRDAEAIFADRHFWIGYREAFEGEDFDADETFGLKDPAAIEFAQVRYENGREIAVCARAAGLVEPWRKHWPLPLNLMRWVLAREN